MGKDKPDDCRTEMCGSLKVICNNVKHDEYIEVFFRDFMVYKMIKFREELSIPENITKLTLDEKKNIVMIFSIMYAILVI
jgi:hypothetical protein